MTGSVGTINDASKLTTGFICGVGSIQCSTRSSDAVGFVLDVTPLKVDTTLKE